MKKFKFSKNYTAALGHFYSSSLAQWKVDEDPAALVAHMKRDNYPFTLWFVPVPITADYKIMEYMPQVDGAMYLGTYKVETS